MVNTVVVELEERRIREVQVVLPVLDCSCEEKHLEVHSFDQHFEVVNCVCECGVLHDFPKN